MVSTQFIRNFPSGILLLCSLTFRNPRATLPTSLATRSASAFVWSLDIRFAPVPEKNVLPDVLVSIFNKLQLVTFLVQTIILSGWRLEIRCVLGLWLFLSTSFIIRLCWFVCFLSNKKAKILFLFDMIGLALFEKIYGKKYLHLYFYHNCRFLFDFKRLKKY